MFDGLFKFIKNFIPKWVSDMFYQSAKPTVKNASHAGSPEIQEQDKQNAKPIRDLQPKANITKAPGKLDKKFAN